MKKHFDYIIIRFLPYVFFRRRINIVTTKLLPIKGEIPMAHTKDIERMLKNLPLGEHKLTDIIKIIVEADQLQQEQLFNNSPYGRIVNKDFDDDFYKQSVVDEFKEYFPNGLEDLWVDITYQRVLKLKQLVKHLKRKDISRTTELGFNKMLAGSIDIVIRPDGRGFVWDGFRRCIIALLNAKRFIKTSIEEHTSTMTIEDCRAVESFVFKIKNGFSESMPKEELYKSGIVHKDPEAMKLYKVIVEMSVDVLGTNAGSHPELGAFSEFQDTVLNEKLDSTDYLVQASYKQQAAWPDSVTLTGYTLCGLAKFLNVIEQEDEDGNPLCPNINIHTAHPNSKKTCDVENALIRYAGKRKDKDGNVVYAHKQTDLCVNRLAGKSIESVAYNIGRIVMGLNNSQQFELSTALGLEGDEDLLHQLTLVPTKKAVATTSSPAGKMNATERALSIA